VQSDVKVRLKVKIPALVRIRQLTYIRDDK